MNQSSSLNPPHLRWIFERPWRFIAFGFGSGLSKLGPGTVGTLWAWAFALIFQYVFAGFTLTDMIILLLFGFGLGCWACGKSGADLQVFDHSGMVWDEIIAFWMILLFVLPASWKIQLLAFVLFRIFDIAKPGPIRWIDAYFKTWQGDGFFEKWPNLFRGFGVMIDDLVAAFFTLIVLSVFIKLGF
jgi:phosphatidylglycerophosphatase A